MNILAQTLPILQAMRRRITTDVVKQIRKATRAEDSPPISNVCVNGSENKNHRQLMAGEVVDAEEVIDTKDGKDPAE